MRDCASGPRAQLRLIPPSPPKTGFICHRCPLWRFLAAEAVGLLVVLTVSPHAQTVAPRPDLERAPTIAARLDLDRPQAVLSVIVPVRPPEGDRLSQRRDFRTARRISAACQVRKAFGMSGLSSILAIVSSDMRCQKPCVEVVPRRRSAAPERSPGCLSCLGRLRSTTTT